MTEHLTIATLHKESLSLYDAVCGTLHVQNRRNPENSLLVFSPLEFLYFRKTMDKQRQDCNSVSNCSLIARLWNYEVGQKAEMIISFVACAILDSWLPSTGSWC